jgi:hypothetical protein
MPFMLKHSRRQELAMPIPPERQLEIATPEEAGLISSRVSELLRACGARTELGYLMMSREVTGMPVVADKLEVSAESMGVVAIGGKWIEMEASADNDRRVYTAKLRWHSSFGGRAQYHQRDWRYLHMNPQTHRPHGYFEGQEGFDTTNAELLVAYNCLAVANGSPRLSIEPLAESAGFELLGFPVTDPVTTEAAA